MPDRQPRSLSPRFTCAIALSCALGCSENPVIREVNSAPVADAGDDQIVPSTGTLAEVWLDGSASTDSDGSRQVAHYRWLSATRPPSGGPGRYVPPGELPDWPADTARVLVRLPEGVWVFSLQVTDDRRATSPQDTVTVTVGSAPVAGAQAVGGNGGGGGSAGSP
jgi:hypothetical protein